MGNFDNIIGYKEVVHELDIILDMLNNTEKYTKLGAEIPKGIMLSGIPGVGKTLLAKDFLKGSNRNTFILHKTIADGGFVDKIVDTIHQAIDSAPSVVLLDDLDKFSNEEVGRGREDTDEFVSVQSMIDEAADKEVFFIATVNEPRKLPRSLLRAKRLEKIIHINAPTLDDAKKIIKYYLSKRPYVDKLDTTLISRLLKGSSCAELETCINSAAVLSAYKDKETIGMDEVIESILRFHFGNVKFEKEKSEYFKKLAAIHEASHAVVNEVLEPGSVDLISIGNYCSDIGGITSLTQNEDYFCNINFMENRITSLLAGKAGVEVCLGILDTGANNDIHRAYLIVDRFVDDYCNFGFNYFERQYSSDALKERKGNAVDLEMQKYYFKAKQIIVNNKEFVEKLAMALMEKSYLLPNDIQSIKEECDLKKQIA